MIGDRTILEFPRSGTTVVSFGHAHDVLCCIAAGPGGYPLHILIDTGTDPSAIDLRLARRIALQMGGSGFGRGAASDMVEFTETELPWLRLGELTIRNLFAPALDLSTMPFPVDVVLGYNVIRQISLQINYQHHWLAITHPDVTPAPISERGAILPMGFFEHFPALHTLVIEGQHIPLVTLDTGSNSTLTVGPDLAKPLGLFPGAANVTAAYGTGFGGSSTVLQRSCPEIHLGPFRLPDVGLDAQLGLVGDLARTGRANIGNGLLSRFAQVSIDYERGWLTLDPGEQNDITLIG
ncbi:MAG: hypothetical protein GFH27_549307n142 [Chloroflexi bacterium AL-W]|nr:hypothetical protein [Chloroflexi bacterium AL-N1]NOK69174.1 hypothetical protein [Chloroflexi bacterium AL-N10]NOK77157.1 hypothetical protein [Chloroflexi bacterium AL-N5]NOK83802.1 hypothetical protein [Chloroflexi bacterium AL-W]NOK91012.1 hypothetical protein [Chloroflexi bacterium AL-N15]